MYLEDKQKFGASTEAEAAPFTLPHLISWLRKQEADGAYDWMDTGNCLLCQYAKSAWKTDTVNWTDVVRAFGGDLFRYPTAIEVLAIDGQKTFGAALSRALELQANAQGAERL